MKFHIKHLTKYRYDDPVSLCHNIAHLKPRALPGRRYCPLNCASTPGPPCRVTTPIFLAIGSATFAFNNRIGASHAWFAVYVPGFGWVDFDPTNDQVPEYQHITTAFGRDFYDVTPVRGVFYGGGEHALDVEVDVDRV